MPRSPFLFTRVLTAWSLGFGVPSAHALTKALAERNGHVLVLELGPRPGDVDAKDDLTPLDLPCAMEGSRASVVAAARAASLEPDRVAPIAASVLDRAGLAGFNLTSNIVDAHLGEPGRPVVLLYPEVHLDWNESAPNLRLHALGTTELVRVTERLLERGARVVNAVEYPWPLDVTLGLATATVERRREVALDIVTKHQISLGFAIAELYPGEVFSVTVDEPSLKARNEVTALASDLRSAVDFDPRRNYLGMLDVRLDQRGSAQLIGNPDIYAFFRDLLRLTPDEIEQKNSDVCEARSREMADRTFRGAADHSASVAYLQLGASHVYGVRKRLRELGASYLILSP